MARGFLKGVLDGFAMADAESSRRIRDEAQTLQNRQLRAQIEDQDRERGMRQARENEVRTAMVGSSNDPSASNYENSFDTGGAVVQPRAPQRPFDAMITAASKRLAAGDVEGYTDLINKGSAAKTLYFTTTFNDAYRRGDVDGMLGLLNEFPDGKKYSVTPGEGGGLIATLSGPDGKPIGSQTFRDVRELGAFIQQKVNPGDIAKAVRDEMEAKSKQAVAEANIRQSNAAADASAFQVTRGQTLLPGELTQQAAQAESTRANTKQSLAAAGASSANAEESRARARTVGMGEVGKRIADLQGAKNPDGSAMFTPEDIRSVVTGAAKGKTREEAITRIAGDLAKEPVNAGMSAEELVAKAAQIVDGAATNAGTARVGTGPGINKGPRIPVVNSEADYNKLPKGATYKDPQGNTRTKQ